MVRDLGGWVGGWEVWLQPALAEGEEEGQGKKVRKGRRKSGLCFAWWLHKKGAACLYVLLVLGCGVCMGQGTLCVFARGGGEAARPVSVAELVASSLLCPLDPCTTPPQPRPSTHPPSLSQSTCRPAPGRHPCPPCLSNHHPSSQINLPLSFPSSFR